MQIYRDEIGRRQQELDLAVRVLGAIDALPRQLFSVQSERIALAAIAYRTFRVGLHSRRVPADLHEEVTTTIAEVGARTADSITAVRHGIDRTDWCALILPPDPDDVDLGEDITGPSVEMPRRYEAGNGALIPRH